MSRAASCAVFAALFGMCVFLCHGIAGTYFGVGMRVGDAVIVATEDGSKIPATVIGFSDRGAKVWSEEPNGFHGKTFVYAYDQCRIVDRESEEWKSLTSASQ